jgi:hypothetical protein
MKRTSLFYVAAALLTLLVLGAGPAQATISINNGASFATSPKVTVDLDFVPTPAKMQFSFDGINFKAPVPFSSPKNIALPAGDGKKTITVRYLDQSGATLAEESASITLDTKSPVISSVVINNKALFTNSRSVILTITYTEVTSGPNSICIREDAAKCAAPDFIPFIDLSPAVMNYDIISPNDGRKNLHVTVKDNAGKTSTPKLAGITLDTTRPAGSIVINNDQPTTTNPLVTLKLKADRASQMKFSFDGGTTFTDYVKFAGIKKVTLPAGAGVKTVIVRFKDQAGNEADAQDSITLLPPAGSTAAVSRGVITAIGSVFVNGVEYSSDGATVKIDDNPSLPADLKEGMVVKVRGDKNEATHKGNANEIEARDALEGTISSVDPVNKTITVMGQIVKVEDNMTRLNDDSLQKVFADANFLVDDHVEVHGFSDDLGGLRATRIVKKAASTEFEAKGFVVGPVGTTSFNLALTKGGTTFITVNFDPAILPVGVTTDSFVEVKSAAAPVAGAITATLIHLEDNIGAAGEDVEVEGIVTSGTLADFIVNGTHVTTSAATVFVGGLGSDFAVGVELEAEGPVDASGTIAATKITFESSIKIEGDVTAVSVDGTATVLGKNIAANQFTRFDTGIPLVGDHVEVRAVLDRNGDILATRVRVLPASTKAFLQGTVTDFNAVAGTMIILGTSIVSDAGTQWRTSSTASDAAVTQTEFFAKLTTNVTIVKVKWDPFVGAAVPIKEAEIEIGK